MKNAKASAALERRVTSKLPFGSKHFKVEAIVVDRKPLFGKGRIGYYPYCHLIITDPRTKWFMHVSYRRYYFFEGLRTKMRCRIGRAPQTVYDLPVLFDDRDYNSDMLFIERDIMSAVRKFCSLVSKRDPI